MKNLFILPLVALFLLSCANAPKTGQGAAIGGAGGAAVGAAISRATGGSGWTGAAIGAVVGTVAGAVIGNTQDQKTSSVQTAASPAVNASSGTEFVGGEYGMCVADIAGCTKKRVWHQLHFVVFRDNGTGALTNNRTTDDFKWARVKGNPSRVVATVTSIGGTEGAKRNEGKPVAEWTGGDFDRGTKIYGQALGNGLIEFNGSYYVVADPKKATMQY